MIARSASDSAGRGRHYKTNQPPAGIRIRVSFVPYERVSNAFSFSFGMAAIFESVVLPANLSPSSLPRHLRVHSPADNEPGQKRERERERGRGAHEVIVGRSVGRSAHR